LEVITRICEKYSEYKSKILFRFTIGSTSSEILKFWEPNAPNYEERKQCLIYAFDNGFSTSVSCEPMLDLNVEKLVEELQHYVTDSIWIGKVNFLLKRLKTNGYNDVETITRANDLVSSQSDENIKLIYSQLSTNNKIKWKESIKKVIGLNITMVKGLDK